MDQGRDFLISPWPTPVHVRRALKPLGILGTSSPAKIINNTEQDWRDGYLVRDGPDPFLRPRTARWIQPRRQVYREPTTHAQKSQASLGPALSNEAGCHDRRKRNTCRHVGAGPRITHIRRIVTSQPSVSFMPSLPSTKLRPETQMARGGATALRAYHPHFCLSFDTRRDATRAA